ncbi:MAG: peroxiredoxin family protein [Armatimonadota bacterium]
MADFEQNPAPRSGIQDSRQPGIGAIAPEFTLTHPAGKSSVSLSDFSEQNVLIVFFRGTWCPNCRRQFRVLCENHDRLTKSGIAVVGVVCQSSGSVGRFLSGSPLPFPLLVDESRTVARLYGVHYWLSYEGFNLANPSLFILDRCRRVMFAYRGKNQSDLPIGSVLEKFVDLLETENRRDTGDYGEG